MNYKLCELHIKYTILSKYEENTHFIHIAPCFRWSFHFFRMFQVRENEISLRNIPEPLNAPLCTSLVRTSRRDNFKLYALKLVYCNRESSRITAYHLHLNCKGKSG